MEHEDQFAPPRLSGRSAFSEETFAGGCGNEKDAPEAADRATAIQSQGSTQADPSPKRENYYRFVTPKRTDPGAR
jgi:hypothetical protein